MKRIKKVFTSIISMVLVISLVGTNCVFANSAITETNDCNELEQQNDIYSTASKIQNEIPNAEVRVSDGIIHIVVEDLSEIPWLENTARIDPSRDTSVTSFSGGSFRYFNIPAYGYLSYTPYSQVYMTKDIVDGLKLKMTEPTICNWIRDQILAGLTVNAISALAVSVWGIEIPVGVVSVVGNLIYWVVSYMNYWSLNSAQNSSSTGKVSVVKGNVPDGYISFIYTPWNNYTCSTYLGYDATWYNGVYDLDDQY